jgi:hypothetical protein
MNPRMLRTLAFIAAALFVVSSVSSAQTPNADVSFYVRVADVEAASFLTSVAVRRESNLVVGPALHGIRLNIDRSYSSTNELFEDIAKRVDGVVVQRGEVTVVKGKCIAGGGGSIEKDLGAQKVSLNFQHIEVPTLLAVLRDFLSNNFKGDSKVARAPTANLGVAVRDVPIASLLDAIAMASGSDLIRGSSGDIAVNARQPAGDCLPRASQFAARSNVQSFAPRLENAQPAGAPLRRVEKLEGYALQSLVARGFMDSPSGRTGFVESPDDLLFTVLKGNYVGRQFGRIDRISDEGIALREIVQDDHGVWRESQNSLAFVPVKSTAER